MYRDPLDLKSGATGKVFKPTPWPVIPWKSFGLPHSIFLQRGYGQLHILCAAFVRNQHRVIHRDGDNIFQANPDQRQAIAFRSQKRVFAIDRACLARKDDTAGIRT